MDITLNRKIFISTLFALGSLIISFVFGSYYTKGDQAHYTYFYETINSYNIVDGYIYYNLNLGASEPIYYLLVFLLNSFFNKLVLFSIINAALGYALAYNLLKMNIKPILLIPFLFNFYLVVLFLAAERLKVSLCFFLFSFLVVNKRNRLIFYFLTFFSHFQSTFLITTQFVESFFYRFKRLYKGYVYRRIIFILPVLFFFVLFSLLFIDSIMGKVTGYSSRLTALENIIGPIIFCFLTIIYRRKLVVETVFLHLPIIVGAYFLGSTRLTIFSYFIFMYFALLYKQGINFGVLISTFYFTIKGILFLKEVYLHGTGF